MALALGTRIGVFEVTGSLGAGGMGEVYRARDTKLGRDVALKILPEQLATDARRLSRFQREAQLLASLNHSNIGSIYGLEDTDGIQALVLELVDGETLAERIARGPIPLDEALTTAKQIAAGLEAAHEKGIIHRDLKPSNIKVKPDGSVKVLDFGLAKALEPGGSGPTSTGTEAGIILGSAAYMSPEQAGGQPVNEQTDLWAFGCVFYEMLTGHRTFRGETFSETVATVLEREPDWSRLPASTPAVVRSLLRQCLRKQPAQRLHDARAARIALEDAIAAPEFATGSVVAPTRHRSWSRLAALLAVAVLAGGVVAWVLKPSPRLDRPISRMLLDVRPAERFVGGADAFRPSRTAIALSHDGQTVVFSGVRGNARQLFKRKLNEVEATPMTGTEGARFPFLSPDGQWVGFQVEDKLKKTPLGGGPPVVICDVPRSPGVVGASWSADDRIVFSTVRGISVVSAAGGTPTAITTADSHGAVLGHLTPHILPGGKAILYTVIDPLGDWDQANVVVQSLDTAERRTLFKGGADARYVPTGHLLYMKTGTLLAVPFDAEKLELRGPPVAILDNVMQAVAADNSDDETGAGQFTISGNGTLAYLTGGIFPGNQYQLVWVDRRGMATALPIRPGRHFAPRVSPDGKRVAYFQARPRSRVTDVWVYEVDRQNSTRLTLEGWSVWPVWAPDGKSLLVSNITSGIENLARLRADGSGALERLTTSKYPQSPASWSAFGNVVAFVETHKAINQIWVLPMDGGYEPKLFLQAPFSLSHPDFSPDGRWLAYVSAESGANEVYVQPYPGPGDKIRVSTDRGNGPVWAKTGRELFYRRNINVNNNVMVQTMLVDIDTTGSFHANKPRVLFEGQYGQATPLRGYDIAPDGQRFIMTTRGSPEPPITQMHVILNWTEELKRLVPTN
jgi:serine/threonine-protein kinase